MGEVYNEPTLTEGREGDPESFALVAGTAVGRYVIEERLGSGGMGVVHAAYDPELDRRVAVKLLHVAPGAADSDESDGRVRLAHEARALARLSDRNVVTVHDVGEHGGRIFIAMELVDGLTLSRWLAKHEPTAAQILDVFIEAGRGLSAVHDAGLVHRDFKPDNLMVTLDPKTARVARVLVMDFGIARSTVDRQPEPEVLAVTEEASSMDHGATRTGGAIGTPAYMSPEQHLRGTVDHRSDQFSFCVALYEALYRQRPFEGGSAPALAFAVLEGAVRKPPVDLDVPRWLWRVLLRGLAALPEDRWPSMEVLVRRLARDRGRVRRGVALAGLSALVGTGAWIFGGAGGDACVEVGTEIDAAWSVDARMRVRASIVGEQGSDAEATADSVGSALDAYASQWSQARVAACHDAPNEAEDLAAQRKACLDDRLRHFDAVVSVLSASDVRAGEDPTRLIDALPRVPSCADAAYLLAQVEPPPSETRDGVDALRAEISRVDVLREAGRYDEAIAAGDPVLLHARALGYAPAIAEAARTLGVSYLELEHRSEAMSLLEEAHLTAGGAGHNTVAAAAAIDLAYASGVHDRNPADAAKWIEHARAYVQRVSQPEELERALRTIEASVAWADHHYEDAVIAATDALAMAEREAGADSRVVARVLQNLALYETKAGRPKDAIAHFERAQAILESELGPHHVSVGDVLANMGIALSNNDQVDEALEAYGRALAIRERTFGAEHPKVGSLVENIAIVHAERGRNELALPMFERSLAIREATLAPDHPSLASGNLNFAISLGLAERHAESVEHLRRALDMTLANGAPDDPTVGMIHFELGNQHNALEQPGQARTHFETAVENLTATLGEKHPHLVVAHAALGETIEAQGAFEDALTAYETALTLGEEVGLRESDLALVRIGTAELRYRLRPEQREASIALMRSSVQVLPDGDNRREAEAWLAERDAE